MVLAGVDHRAAVIREVVGFEKGQKGRDIAQNLSDLAAQDLPARRTQDRIGNFQVSMNRHYGAGSVDHQFLDVTCIGR